MFSSIESVFMNESYIILIYAHQIDKCCEVYDYKMERLFNFGQQTNQENGFYMEKSKITLYVWVFVNFFKFDYKIKILRLNCNFIVFLKE
jgi:hypothetical protein